MTGLTFAQKLEQTPQRVHALKARPLRANAPSLILKIGQIMTPTLTSFAAPKTMMTSSALMGMTISMASLVTIQFQAGTAMTASALATAMTALQAEMVTTVSAAAKETIPSQAVTEMIFCSGLEATIISMLAAVTI